MIYDTLIKSNPYTTEWEPWIAKNFTVGNYTHPIYGQRTKVKVTLRTDVTWNDGSPLTTADVYFTFVELKRLLEKYGYPPPSWIENVESILDFKVLDPYNFEILFNVTKNFWVLSWIGNTPILPKHVWKPIILSGNPTNFAPDPNMIGCGPWRLKDYTRSSIELVANKPCSKVQTNLPGSQLIHSPYGFFKFYPLYVDMHFQGFGHKIDPFIETVPYKVTLQNLIMEEMIVESANVDLSNPISSIWNETWPTYTKYSLVDWKDGNDDKRLSKGDTVALIPVKEEPTVPPMPEWYNVEILLFMPPGPVVMRLSPVIVGIKRLFLDDVLLEELQLILKSNVTHQQERYYWPTAGKHTLKLAFHMEEPNWNNWNLYCKWVNYTLIFWVTLKEDIAGSSLYDDIGLPNYPYKSELPSPDIKVDIKDIATAAKAFGTYPGHKYWNPVADINCDYRIDIKDIAAIAKRYGWH